MRFWIITPISFYLLFGCSDPNAPGAAVSDSSGSPTKEAAALSAAQAKALIPEAASVPNAEFEALATSPSPLPLESRVLTMVCLALDPFQEGKKNPAVLEEFRFLGETYPKPKEIAEVVWASKGKGYATLIQPDFITDCQCQSEGDTATGTVSFEAEGLYSGKVEFTARRKDGSWRIEEFRLPRYGLKTSRGSDGVWRQSSLEPADG